MDENIFEKGKKFPKIVSIGGGTGLSVVLRSLKKRTPNLTAVVTVADDGGGSGRLRRDLKMPPPGDIRNCILALAETEPVMESLLRYRFSDGELKGQNFGNLFLAAMTGISDGNFVEAVRRVSEVLKVSGCVLPVTDADVELLAVLENGVSVCGESKIGFSTHDFGSKISGVKLRRKDGKALPISPLPSVISAIEDADLITLGPGSLYTSIIPNLIVPGVADAVFASKAPVVYINNIMTQPGETDGYSARDHYDAIIAHTMPNFIDFCIVNTGGIDRETEKRYTEDGAAVVRYEKDMFADTEVCVIESDMVRHDGGETVRHDTETLAELITELRLSRHEG